MRIHVDLDHCIGTSNCVTLLPDVFTQDEAEGLVELVDETGAGRGEAAVRDLGQACPAQAIDVVEGG